MLPPGSPGPLLSFPSGDFLKRTVRSRPGHQQRHTGLSPPFIRLSFLSAGPPADPCLNLVLSNHPLFLSQMMLWVSSVRTLTYLQVPKICSSIFPSFVVLFYTEVHGPLGVSFCERRETGQVCSFFSEHTAESCSAAPGTPAFLCPGSCVFAQTSTSFCGSGTSLRSPAGLRPQPGGSHTDDPQTRSQRPGTSGRRRENRLLALPSLLPAPGPAPATSPPRRPPAALPPRLLLTRGPRLHRDPLGLTPERATSVSPFPMYSNARAGSGNDTGDVFRNSLYLDIYLFGQTWQVCSHSVLQVLF